MGDSKCFPSKNSNVAKAQCSNVAKAQCSDVQRRRSAVMFSEGVVKQSDSARSEGVARN